MAKFLKPDKVVKANIGKHTLTINQKIIPDSLVATKDIASWCKKGQKMKPCAKLNGGTGKPKAITVHNTNDIKAASGTNAAEQYTRATYSEHMSGVVVHFYVWHDEIWQNLNENERGWHAADGSSRRKDHRGGQTGGNLDTIAIESIGADSETEDTVAKLVAYLCKKHGLDPKYDVYTHNYWMYGGDKKYSGVRKNCPVYILPHWSKFLENVQSYYSSDTASKKVLYRVQCGAYAVKHNAVNLKNKLVKDGYKDAYVVSANGLYKVQCGAFSVKANAEKLQAELKSKGYKTFIVQQEVS